MSGEKLLLLSCCAPCSCGVIKKLALQGRSFSVLFYNPNIDQAQEYQTRLLENKRVCEEFGVPFVDLAYEPFPRIPVNEDCVLLMSADSDILGRANVRVYYYYRSV